jgi:hypothetical protein
MNVHRTIKSSDYHKFACVLIILSILIWCYLFRSFLNARNPLVNDAFPYLGHIRFYLENMIHGIYPFWDPSRDYGAVNEFFLRRIGEFNPFFWVILILRAVGLPFEVAHRLFLGGYYFLGVGGFYLLSRRLFRNEETALISGALLLFSSLGTKIFESFIILEVVPALWFGYFLVAFVQSPSRFFLLGLTFCLMIINITYIPFYFYTILMVFIFSFVAVYSGQLRGVFQGLKKFFASNKLFALICGLLWVVSMIPGYLWYRAGCIGEALSTARHAGSASSNVAIVGINKVNEGGILAHLILDRQFIHLDKLEMGDFYLPVIIFLFLLTIAWVKINRRLTLFFVFGGIMFLIGIADASWVHVFLFHHVPFFKYFRNIQFFLWLAVLPVFILFVMEGMTAFLNDGKRSSAERKWLSLWVVIIHVGAAAFCWDVGTVGNTVYAVIGLSLIHMLGRLWTVRGRWIWFIILWLAVVVQPIQVYSRFDRAYASDEPQFGYGFHSSLILPSRERAQVILKGQSILPPGTSQSYFSIRWHDETSANVDRQILLNYLETPFVIYDSTEMMPAAVIDYRQLEKSLAHFVNVAYVHSEVPSVLNKGHPQARIPTDEDKDFQVIGFDPNHVAVQTAFDRQQFLVRTANYHTGWRVTIDGKSAPLMRANGLSQGVWVPAGKHVIDWRFGSPWRFALSWSFVFLYLGILGWLGWMGWRCSVSK